MKKKLLFVQPSMHFGGAEKSLQTLLCTIDYDRYDVDLLLLRPEGELLELLPPQVRLLELPQTAQLFSLPMLQAMTQFVRRGRLSTAWARLRFSAAVRGDLPIRMLEQRGWKYQKKAYEPLPDVYDAAIAYLEGSPIYYCADFVRAKKKFALIHNDYRKLQLNKAFDDAYFCRFDALITVSQTCAQVLAEEFPAHREKICVIENILSAPLLHALGAKEVSFDPEYTGLRVLTMGRLDAQKGLDLAVEACAKLAREIDFRWYVLGEGPLRAELTQQIERCGLQDRFILLGAQINPYPYLAACDVYAQPSRFEGKSIALEEAKCFARPILTTAFTTVADQIEDGVTGCIAQIDADDIAEKLRCLLTDAALRARLSDALRDYPGNVQEIEKYYAMIES